PSRSRFRKAPSHSTATARERAGVEKATQLLQSSANEFFQQSGCVGCHHQQMTVMASAAARRDAAGLVKTIATQFSSAQDNLMQRFDPGGGGDGEGYAALALHAAAYAPDAVTD